jgi:drug/metabolite transporter (DMT)-like permease
MSFSSKAQPQLLAFSALILAMILWASSFIALKFAFRTYHPLVVIFGRMFIASICFLLVGKRLAQSLHYRKGDYKLILFMALCEPCLYFLFEAKAVVNTTASQAGLITAMLPILVMAAAAIFLKESITWRSIAGSTMAVSGVCWLTLLSSPTAESPNPLLGNFLEFLAMVCATGYTIAIKSLTERYEPFFLTALQAFAGCVFYFPLLFFPGTELPTGFHLEPALAVLYLGAIITLGAYGLYNYGLKHVPASRAASYVNLIPVFSVIMGWLILDESLSAGQTAAAAVVMGGVYLTQK